MYDHMAFLTDYGRRDGFVAMCHGVVATIAPHVRIIDVTHDVPAHDVRNGAAVLAQTVPYLPPSVVVAVVDPGVGTSRRGVAMTAGDSVLIGPDNGLLGWAADALGGAGTVVALENDEYLRRGAAVTFDGRDVFAPVAAGVATGVPVGDLGPRLPGMERLPEPRRDVGPGRIETEVLTADHFGNVQLACTGADLAAAGFMRGDDVIVSAHVRRTPVPVGRTFADAPPGAPVLFVDSAGHAAIAVNRGDAAARFSLGPADPVLLSRPTT